jgi:hypothetical protein
MSVFGRVNYNFDSNKFGSAQYLPEETVKALKLTTRDDLYTWQKERLAEGTPIDVSEYRQNPLANLCNTILSQVESIITVTESPPADWGTWVSGTVNPANLLTAAESARDEIKLFTDHTCNISGVPAIHITVESPEPNVPTYETATMYGRQALDIFYQTDEVANAIPILGSFTSLYIKTDIESANANLSSNSVNDFITNPAAATTGVVTGMTSNLNSLITLLQTRRLHDWQFFSNTKIIIDEYQLLKSLEIGGKSNTEFNLIQNFVGTSKYKDALDSQVEEANEREYNEEYVPTSGYGGGTGPEEPVNPSGADTETCTIPEQPPQFTFNFIETVAPPPPVPPGPTCKSGPVNYLWNFNYNVSTNPPTPEPVTNTTRWIAIGKRNSVFSIKMPPANKWKEIFGTSFNPAKITINFCSRAGRVFPDGRIFVSECPGDFDTPLPGNSKQRCTGVISGAYGSFGIVTATEGVYASGYFNAPIYLANREFYFNFQYIGPEDDNLGAFVDVNINSASGGSLGSGTTGAGGIESVPKGTPQYNPSNFVAVDEILNIPVATVPPDTEPYLYYQIFLPDTWGASAQDTYNRVLSLGISPIWSAYWNALPDSTKLYVTPPATSRSDPTWIYKASQEAESWITFNGKNPFK